MVQDMHVVTFACHFERSEKSFFSESGSERSLAVLEMTAKGSKASNGFFDRLNRGLRYIRLTVNLNRGNFARADQAVVVVIPVFILPSRYFIPNSPLTSRCIEKSKTAELLTGVFKFRNCMSDFRCSSSSFSVGMALRVKAGRLER